jgi:hypothetical protein
VVLVLLRQQQQESWIDLQEVYAACSSLVAAQINRLIHQVMEAVLTDADYGDGQHRQDPMTMQAVTQILHNLVSTLQQQHSLDQFLHQVGPMDGLELNQLRRRSILQEAFFHNLTRIEIT